MKHWWTWLVVGTIVGCLTAYGIVRLGMWGIETNGWINMLSAFLFGPIILFASMPWSLLLPNATGDAVTLTGLATGFIINGGLLGACVGLLASRNRRRK